jgi:cytochrome oxidase assembly protein ShyY1
MNNKRKKSNFLKNLLTTASVASVIVRPFQTDDNKIILVALGWFAALD